LSKIMQRFHDAKSFASLEDGMSLELIRRGLNADAVMCASDVSGAKPRPVLMVTNNKSGKSELIFGRVQNREDR